MAQRVARFGERRIWYEVKKVARAKRIRISVHPGGRVLVTLPKWIRIKQAEEFIQNKSSWVLKNLDHLEKVQPAKNAWTRRREYLTHKEVARSFLLKRTRELNEYYGFHYGKISVRNQKTRWGSCSSRGNISFHYKIYFLPPELADYIIVHELCHLRELNHSKRFWNLVSHAISDYETKKKALRKMSAL